MSASSAMKHPEGNKDVVGSCRSITELQEESARLLVDSLRKEIFAAQKNNGGFSTLILRIQEVSIALNGSRTTPAKCTPSIVATKSHNTVGSNSGSVDNFGNANEKPIYYHHHCSIVLSLYTLFTRVLASSAIAVPAISDNSDDNREGAYSAYNATSSSAKNQPPIPSSTAHSISDLLLPLRIQSLSLLCSAASYDPSKYMYKYILYIILSFVCHTSFFTDKINYELADKTISYFFALQIYFYQIGNYFSLILLQSTRFSRTLWTSGLNIYCRK